MANEIVIPDGISGRAAYAVVRDSVGRVWDTVSESFVTYDGGDLGDYVISLTEQGASGVYAGDFPALPVGTYSVDARSRAGGAPAESDVIIGAGSVSWTGTAVTSPSDAVALPPIPAGWVTADGIAAHALDGKGDWLSTSEGAQQAVLGAHILTLTSENPRLTDSNGTPLTAVTFGQCLAALFVNMFGDRSGVGTRVVAATVPGVTTCTLTAERVSRSVIQATSTVPVVTS